MDSLVSNKKGICCHVKHGRELALRLRERRGELSAVPLWSQKRVKNRASSKVWAAHTPPATDRIQAGKLTVVYAINLLFSVARRYFRWNGDTLKMFILS